MNARLPVSIPSVPISILDWKLERGNVCNNVIGLMLVSLASRSDKLTGVGRAICLR